MFFCCQGLTSLDVSGFDTSNVTHMGFMFSRCDDLTSLDVSRFNTINVTMMDYMFNGCADLTTIYVSSSFVTTNVSNSESYMFSGSTKLKGGAGTTFNSSKLDKTYVLIDGTGSQTGYFTAKPKACAGSNTSLQAQIKIAVCNHELNFNHADGFLEAQPTKMLTFYVM